MKGGLVFQQTLLVVPCNRCSCERERKRERERVNIDRNVLVKGRGGYRGRAMGAVAPPPLAGQTEAS